MPDCWNCGTHQAETHRFCARCGQLLNPGPAERSRLVQGIDYLLRETSRWGWLEPARRQALHGEYARRRQDLIARGPTSQVGPAPSATPGPTPQVRTDLKTPAPTSQVGPAPSATPGPTPQVRTDLKTPGPTSQVGPAPSATPGWLSAFLEEANIRWFLILGGLLLASAGIGLLSSQWSAHGRTLVPLALLAAPILCFIAAGRLRPSFPHSSRVLALLGGLLLPTGLVSVRLFELGGLKIPWSPWNFAVFLASSMVLLVLGWSLREVLCLYLASAGLAASSAALATWLENPPAFGLGCLAVASIWLGAALKGGVRLAPFQSHFFGLSQALIALGLLSTLPAFFKPSSEAPLGELSLLLLGAAFMAAAGFLQKSRAGVLWSAPAALAALLLFGLHTEHPPVLLGHALVALGALYSGIGHFLRQRPEQAQAAEAALQVGTVLLGIPLVLLLTAFLMQGLPGNFSSTPDPELRTALGVALAAAFLQTLTGAACAMPGLFYASTTSLAYAWFLGSVLWHRHLPGMYGFDLSWLPLVWTLLAWLLRRVLPENALNALIRSALILSLLPAPLNLGMKALQVPGAEASAPGTLVLSALTLVLATPWLRSGRLLYLASLWAFLAYELGWPRILQAFGAQAPDNQALDFFPLLIALAFVARVLHRKSGPEYALPVGRSALFLACSLACWQLHPDSGDRHQAAASLLLDSLAFAALARLFRDWRFLHGSAQDLLAHLAGLALAGSLWVMGGDGEPSSHLALMGFSLITLSLARAPLPECARRPLEHLGLACAPLISLAGPLAAGPNPGLQALFATGPGLIWLVWSWQSRKPAWLVTGAVLQALTAALIQIGSGLPALGHTWPGLLGMVLLASALALRAGPEAWAPPNREAPQADAPPGPGSALLFSLVPAWLFAGAAWDGLLLTLSCPEEERMRLWALFWLLVCAVAAWGRIRGAEAGRVMEGCAQVSGLLYLARAALASGAAFLQADLLVAGVLLGTGWCRSQPAAFILGWALLTLAPVQAEIAVLGDGPLAGRAGVELAVLVAAAAVLGRAAIRSGRALLAESLAPLARLTALGAGVLSLIEKNADWATTGLLVTTLGLWLQAAWKPSRLDWHLGFLAAWGAWGTRLQHSQVTASEAWFFLPALWLLFWGERHRAEGRRSLADLLAASGLLLGLGPSFLATATGGETWHAIYLVVGALAMLMFGVGRRIRIHAVGSSLALLAEIVVQALQLAARMPWWYVALASGLLLVGLGVLFERRRMELLRAGQRLFQEVSGWEADPPREAPRSQSTDEGREASRSPR